MKRQSHTVKSVADEIRAVRGDLDPSKPLFLVMTKKDDVKTGGPGVFLNLVLSSPPDASGLTRQFTLPPFFEFHGLIVHRAKCTNTSLPRISQTTEHVAVKQDTAKPEWLANILAEYDELVKQTASGEATADQLRSMKLLKVRVEEQHFELADGADLLYIAQEIDKALENLIDNAQAIMMMPAGSDPRKTPFFAPGGWPTDSRGKMTALTPSSPLISSKSTVVNGTRSFTPLDPSEYRVKLHLRTMEKKDGRETAAAPLTLRYNTSDNQSDFGAIFDLFHDEAGHLTNKWVSTKVYPSRVGARDCVKDFNTVNMNRVFTPDSVMRGTINLMGVIGGTHLSIKFTLLKFAVTRAPSQEVKAASSTAFDEVDAPESETFAVEGTEGMSSSFDME